MSGTAGVYRSEKYVVVERHRHQFPQCCIWCGSAITGSAAPASPDGNGAIKPPICSTCTATRNRLPKTVGIFGLIMLAAAPLVYSSLGAMVAGALLLTGCIDLVIAWRLHVAASGYRAMREDEQYVWISGAHATFLATLSPWSGMKFGEMRDRDR